MKIKILGNVKIKGKETPLINYQYVAEDDTPISAIFQATKSSLPNEFILEKEKQNVSNK